MAVRRVDKEKEAASRKEILEAQIGDLGGIPYANDDVSLDHIPDEEQLRKTLDKTMEEPQKESLIGKKLQRPTTRMSQEEMNQLSEEKKLSRVGESIATNAEIRDGWMEVDRQLLGDRSKFYPEDWEFRIRPATVEAIRNWSTIDENSMNSIDVVFDEILKSCLAIRTSHGSLPWNRINTWDRFFFILLIREYTFAEGEKKLEYTRECSNCESEVTFTLESQALMYDMPDDTVMKYYIPESQTWVISPADFDIETPEEEIVMFLPTREKDANIKAYLVDRVNQDQNAKIDRVFMKFLPWMLQKVSKDLTIARQQIRKAENIYKSWDVEMFEFMDSVVDNISVTPQMNLSAICPACGEEVTSRIQFPNGVSDLFKSHRTRKRFGTK